MNSRSILPALGVSVILGSCLTMAQAPAQPPAPQPMSFFVTSVGAGNGANLGGLAGADRHCQALATAVGAGGKTWHAYLSANAAFVGCIYCPNAAFTLGGGGNNAYDFVGASVSNTVKLNGHFKFHYDENLRRIGPGRGYIATSWLEM